MSVLPKPDIFLERLRGMQQPQGQPEPTGDIFLDRLRGTTTVPDVPQYATQPQPEPQVLGQPGAPLPADFSDILNQGQAGVTQQAGFGEGIQQMPKGLAAGALLGVEGITGAPATVGRAVQGIGGLAEQKATRTRFLTDPATGMPQISGQHPTTGQPVVATEQFVADPTLKKIGGILRAVGKVVERNPLSKAGEFVAEAAREGRETHFPPPEDAKPFSWTWFAYHGPQAIGTMGVAVATGGIVGASAKAAAVVGATTAGAIEARLNESEYKALLMAKGYDEQEATDLAAMGAVAYGVAAGVVEVFPMMSIFAKTPGLRGRFIGALKTAVQEGGEESVQEFLDATTRVLSGIDEDAIVNMTGDQLLQAFVLGGIAGGAVSVVTSGKQPPVQEGEARTRAVPQVSPRPSTKPDVPPSRTTVSQPAAVPEATPRSVPAPQESLESLPYRELQARAKAAGIPARQSKPKLVEALENEAKLRTVQPAETSVVAEGPSTQRVVPQSSVAKTARPSPKSSKAQVPQLTQVSKPGTSKPAKRVEGERPSTEETLRVRQLKPRLAEAAEATTVRDVPTRTTVPPTGISVDKPLSARRKVPVEDRPSLPSIADPRGEKPTVVIDGKTYRLIGIQQPGTKTPIGKWEFQYKGKWHPVRSVPLSMRADKFLESVPSGGVEGGAAAPTAPQPTKPSVVPAPQGGKQAWEMTREEWRSLATHDTYGGSRKALDNVHEREVREAISRGDIESHPDYPELTKEPTVAKPQPPQRRGLVSLDPIIKTVEAGLKAGKWSVEHTQSAARWVWHTLGGQAKVGDARKSLIGRFGDAIKRRFGKIWKAFRGWVRGELIGIKEDIPAAVFKTEKPASRELLTRVAKDIRKSKPVRNEYEELKHKARKRQAATMHQLKRKYSGTDLIHRQRAAMRGQLPIPDQTFEPIGKDYTEEEKLAVINHAMFHQAFDEYIFQGVNVGDVINGIFDHGRLPTETEMRMLDEVLGPQIVRALLGKKGLGYKAGRIAFEIVSTPKTLLSGFDISALGRQGLRLYRGHPIISTRAILPMLKGMLSEGQAAKIDDELGAREYEIISRRSKLSLTKSSTRSTGIAEREEAFHGTWLQRLPVIRALIRPWERAFITFLNVQRAGVFDLGIDIGRKIGAVKTLTEPNDYTRAVATIVNVSSGRSTLDMGELATALNTGLYSPRLWLSHAQWPFVITRALGRKGTRRLAAQQLFGTAVFYLAVASMVKIAAEAFDWDVEWDLDWQSPTFSKVRVGDKTTISLNSEAARVVSIVARSLWGTRDVETGRVRKPGFGTDIIAIAGNYVRGKLSPSSSLVVSLIRRKRYMGEPLTVKGLAADVTIPISLKTIDELAGEHDPWTTGVLMGFESVGLGVNVWNPYEEPGKRKTRQKRKPRRKRQAVGAQ